MMDDYYAGPLTALIACNRERRVLVAGTTTPAITGWADDEMIGQEVSEALTLAFPGSPDDPIARSLEWGVRVLQQPCTFRPLRTDEDRDGVVDIFPAYDQDGGLMLALTPVTKG